MMIRFRSLPLCRVVVVLLIVAGPARGNLVGAAAREVAERLGRGLRGTAARRAVRHVDDAARAVAPHLNVGMTVAPMARSSSRAMAALAPRNARRLAILAEDGALARSGRWSELLAVIERHGDQALNFVWRNKGALAVGTVLGTFLADPEAFLGGGRELIGGAAQGATQPLADAADAAASRWKNIARSVVVGLACLVLVPALVVSIQLVGYIHRRSRR
jgi:hypothetical protein